RTSVKNRAATRPRLISLCRTTSTRFPGYARLLEKACPSRSIRSKSKQNWLPVSDIPAFTLNRITAADVPRAFHVNTGNDGKQYALVAMHVISKLVPNWTWATFEHQLNPARCDILGCDDKFGAAQAVVPPNRQPGRGY